MEGLLTREVEDLADQVLAGVVFGMGLAGEEDLQRAVLVGEERHESRDIVEEQVAALIGGDAAGEADGQRLGIEAGERLLDLGRGDALTAELVAREFDQSPAAVLVGVP